MALHFDIINNQINGYKSNSTLPIYSILSYKTYNIMCVSKKGRLVQFNGSPASVYSI